MPTATPPPPAEQVLPPAAGEAAFLAQPITRAEFPAGPVPSPEQPPAMSTAGPSRHGWLWPIVALVAIIVAGGIGAFAVLGTSSGDKSGAVAKRAAAPREAPSSAPDRNLQIADQMAKTSGGRNLAAVCQGLPTLGRARAEAIASKELGALIIEMGGSPSKVISNLLNRC
jgi:hypothetical protein